MATVILENIQKDIAL